MIETSKAMPNSDELYRSHNKILIVLSKINAWEYSKRKQKYPGRFKTNEEKNRVTERMINDEKKLTLLFLITLGSELSSGDHSPLEYGSCGESDGFNSDSCKLGPNSNSL